MEHKESLRVLGLTEYSSLQDLSIKFRKLSKKYHPDLNRDREEWSNRQMRILNEAYRKAHQYLSKPETERIVQAPPKNKPKPKATKVTKSFRQSIDSSLRLLYRGMETYYQYGLDIIPLRKEGTRRSRYNSSIRKIKRCFALLKPLAESPMSELEETVLERTVHFIRFFYKNIHINSIRAAESTPFERKAFNHYLQGSQLVDMIIKEIVFPDFVESFKKGRLPENIKLAEAQLNTVLIDFSEAHCKREAEIKKELLYALLDLTELQELNHLSFY